MQIFLHAVGYSILIFVLLQAVALGGWTLSLNPNDDDIYMNVVFSIMMGIGMSVLFNHIEK